MKTRILIAVLWLATVSLSVLAAEPETSVEENAATEQTVVEEQAPDDGETEVVAESAEPASEESEKPTSVASESDSEKPADASAEETATATDSEPRRPTPAQLVERVRQMKRQQAAQETSEGSSEQPEEATVASETHKPGAEAAAGETSSAASGTGRLPTPGDLVEKMRQSKREQAEMPKIAHFDLTHPIVERPPDFSLFGVEHVTTLRSVLDRLDRASRDDGVHAVLITLGADSPAFAQAQELRDALLRLNRAGKQTFVYADSFDTASYTLASGARHICMMETGEIVIPGISVQAMFARGLLEKLGIQADSIQIGEYKGADEHLTRSEASEELRGELKKLTEGLYEQIVDGISLNRNVSRREVRRMIDEVAVRGSVAKQRGFVDHLLDMDGLRDLLRTELNEESIELVHNYGRDSGEEIDFSNPFIFFSMLTRRPPPPDRPQVALIYAEGLIVDGQGGEGMFSRAVGSEDMRKALRIARRDEMIKAVVLRVDSPGGSALASEAIWQAVRRVAEEKPVVVSISSTAASGGYYIACAGDMIFADPAAIVGSIGVVGGKFVLRDLFDKVGLTTESFTEGLNADVFSVNQPFNERQRRMITGWMRETYDIFTSRVMETRAGKIKDIDQVARGRVFLGKQAVELGMVDALGGLEDAIAEAAKRAELEPGSYGIRELPSPRTLADLFAPGAGAVIPQQPAAGLGLETVLLALDPELRQMILQQAQVLQMMQKRPVMLVMPYSIRVR